MSTELEKSFRTASRFGLIMGPLIVLLGIRSLYEYRSTGQVWISDFYSWGVGSSAAWPIVSEFSTGILLFGYGVYYRLRLRRLRSEDRR